MKNACIVGYGAIGPVHADAITNTDCANLYAVCDINADKAKLCTDKYGCKAYCDFDEMLKDEDIDVVHICTPHYLHKDMTISALAAGKDVVLEKPVAMNRAEFRELMDYVESNGKDKNLCIMLQNRTTLNKVIEKADVDAVVVAVPHYDHPRLVIQALKKGISAICEKPAGVYTKQVREMNEYAATKDLVFAMMFMMG